MLKDFYKKSQQEIVELTDTFLKNEFFPVFPKWKDHASIVIGGSVAYGLYDEYSDIDLKIFVPKKLITAYTKERVRRYKKHLRSANEPIQLHSPETFEQLERRMSDWSRD